MIKNKFCLAILMTLALSVASMASVDRMERTFGVSFNTGWNSLAGFGPSIHSRYSDFTVDTGIGLSAFGVKTGVRGRYLFAPEKKVTPFIGLGLLRGFGAKNVQYEESIFNVVRYDLEATDYLQYTLGLDIQANGGFYMLLVTGYAQSLNEDNVKILSGTPSLSFNEAVDVLYKSGPVFELSLGYSF